MEVSPGEIFDLIIYAEDENGNSKDAVYSYYTPDNLTASPSSLIYVNLDPNRNNSVPRFTSVNKATGMSYTVQRTSLVLRNSEQLESKCLSNNQNDQYFNLSFSFNLIDSSDGQLVCEIL